MIPKKLMTKKFLVGSVLGAILSAAIISGCAVDTGLEAGRDSDRATVKSGATPSERVADSGSVSIAVIAKATNPGEKAAVGTTLVVMVAVQVLTGGGEINEAAMSSPITPLGQSWNGVLGGLAVTMQYDAATQSVHGTVRNTLPQRLCYVQAEPHLKSGTKTVGELGPEKLGHLNPGQEVTTSLSVASEPKLAGVSYDGYVVHMEVFDCSGPGPATHTGGEGAEGGGANTLALDETFDTVRSGARLVLSYDAPSNSFKGTVENTTNRVLDAVRIEVHLSNGSELGPTTPTDMAPGEMIAINLPASQASFTEWTAHAEVGAGGEGGESGGEHRDGGEHGSDSESGGEHGGGGERRGGG